MSINGAQNCSISGINITGNCLNDNVWCDINCYCNNVGCHINEGNIYIVGEAKIGDKPVKDVYVVGTDWDTFMKILQEKGELKDVVIENGQIVTDPKRKAEIKENAKKEIELGKLQYEKEMKEYRDNMQKMSAEMQNMQQALNYLIDSIPDYVEKPVNEPKVKKMNAPIKPKEVDPTVIIADGLMIKTPSPEEARQRAFDNLLSTLKKDLEPEQFSAYSSLIEILRKSQNGDPESITTLYNSMFQGEKKISEVETMPPQYEIEPVVHQNIADEAERQTVNTGGEQSAVCQGKHLLEQKVSDKSNDEADKSKDTINQINEEILQR